jgi:hypothetical protein
MGVFNLLFLKYNNIMKNLLQLAIINNDIDFFKLLLSIDIVYDYTTINKISQYDNITYLPLELLIDHKLTNLEINFIKENIIFTSTTIIKLLLRAHNHEYLYNNILLICDINNITFTQDQIICIINSYGMNSYKFIEPYIIKFIDSIDINVELIKCINGKSYISQLLQNKICSYVKNNHKICYNIIEYALKCNYISLFLNNILVFIKNLELPDILVKINDLEFIFSTIVACKSFPYSSYISYLKAPII